MRYQADIQDKIAAKVAVIKKYQPDGEVYLISDSSNGINPKNGKTASYANKVGYIINNYASVRKK